MNQTIVFKERAANITKTWMLMSVILVAFIFLGFAVSQYINAPQVLYGFVAASLVFNFFGYWFSDKIALGMHGAKEITVDSHSELVGRIAALARKASLPMPRMYLIDDPSPNAFATGRNPRNASVAMTTGIVHSLTPEELDGVIAHELAHIGNRDILLSTVVVVLVGALSIVADFMTRSMLFGGSNSRENNNGIFSIVIAIVASIAIPIVGLMLQMAVSRRREYLADATGAMITGKPQQLALALAKISSSHTPKMHEAHQATAHLFFANPVGADVDAMQQGGSGDMGDEEVPSRAAGLFSTHPPIRERIRKLEIMAGLRSAA
jgi:heat shock protein HtpX